MKRISQMGIRRKVFLACLMLALILFFSSLISIFEFSRMSDYVSEQIAGNITSVNTAREMVKETESYNFRLMQEVTDDATELSVINDDRFIGYYADLENIFTTKEERIYADSVRFAYTAYMQVVREAKDVWKMDQEVRSEWCFNKLQPIYVRLRSYLQKLTEISQNSLVNNSQSLQDSFYRSIMPGFISVLLGMVLVFLFNYFLNYYIVSPILKMKKGISGYTQFGKEYDVRIENEDELQELNDSVKDIIDLNNSYKKQL